VDLFPKSRKCGGQLARRVRRRAVKALLDAISAGISIKNTASCAGQGFPAKWSCW
jgi:hypothetical protein